MRLIKLHGHYMQLHTQVIKILVGDNDIMSSKCLDSGRAKKTTNQITQKKPI
jgi:hypothetical protein